MTMPPEEESSLSPVLSMTLPLEDVDEDPVATKISPLLSPDPDATAMLPPTPAVPAPIDSVPACEVAESPAEMTTSAPAFDEDAPTSIDTPPDLCSSLSPEPTIILPDEPSLDDPDIRLISPLPALDKSVPNTSEPAVVRLASEPLLNTITPPKPDVEVPTLATKSPLFPLSAIPELMVIDPESPAYEEPV
jgi:hypothetical protein